MTFLVIADIDDLSWRGTTEPADILISCGDVADAVIVQAAETVGARHILAVRGNHDPNVPFPAPIIDLHLHVVEIDGLVFGGFEGCWKYKPRGHHLYTQEGARRLLDAMPRVDVLVTHNSPRGVHDVDDDVHLGFEALNEYIGRVQPRFHLHGHQHVNRQTVIGKTRVVGVYGWAGFEV